MRTHGGRRRSTGDGGALAPFPWVQEHRLALSRVSACHIVCGTGGEAGWRACVRNRVELSLSLEGCGKINVSAGCGSPYCTFSEQTEEGGNSKIKSKNYLFAS